MSQKVNSLRGHGQGGLGLLVKQVLSRKTRGIGLIETLVGGAIGAVVVAGTMKSLQLSLESNLVAKATLAEMDIQHTIRQALQGNKQDCLANFTPEEKADPDPYAQGIYGDDREWGIGEVFQLYKDGAKVLEKKQTFKGSLEIVKMSLKGVKPTIDPNSKRINHGGPAVIRQFVVYYKKVNMGGYSTLAGNPCTESDLSGCYFEQCPVTLRVDDDDDKDTAPSIPTVCNSGTCANYGSQGSGPPPCYKVDQTDTSGNEARTLVGCGGANRAGGTKATVMGYGAGIANTGTGNTFIGYKAGLTNTASGWNTFLGSHAGQVTTGNKNTFIGFNTGEKNTTGASNTFLGSGAGKTITEGDNNIAIGHDVQLDSATADNQINIGNIIKAGQEDKSSDDTTKIGVLKVCNSSGDECIELKNFECPDNHYFKGFYQQDTTVDGVQKKKGEPICHEETFCPTSLYHWTPENICHKCPRDSPLYRANATPPDCASCASHSIYVLTGTNKNQCISNCPLSQPHYYSWRCNKCPQNRPHYDQVDQRCLRCHDNQPYFYNEQCNKCHQTQILVNNVCQCPSATPHLYGGQCNKCRSNQVVSNGHCCPPATPHYYSKNGRLRCNKCPSGQVASNNHCCDSATPHHYSGQCNPCPQNRPHLYTENNRCYKCPKTAPARHGENCHPCRGGYFSFSGWKNCACNDPGHAWVHIGDNLPQCTPCGTATQRRLKGVRVTEVWGCEYRCTSPHYPAYIEYEGHGYCCPENGPCCRVGSYFEGGRCKKRVGNEIWSCPERFYALNRQTCRSMGYLAWSDSI